jgi:hypothetical protein
MNEDGGMNIEVLNEEKFRYNNDKEVPLKIELYIEKIIKKALLYLMVLIITFVSGGLFVAVWDLNTKISEIVGKFKEVN